MKRVSALVCIFSLLVLLTACQDCPEVEEIDCPECEECLECEPCEETPQLYFYEEMYFEGSGYTPGYNYYLSGALDEQGVIQQIRFNMVSIYGVSKRSSDYLMNNATLVIGGSSGHQTMDLFIGGSTESIPQVFNTIKGEIASDGSTLLMDLGIMGAYPGAVVNHQDEIYGLLESALNITIDETTTVAEFLSPLGLYDEEEALVDNGVSNIELTGAYGGRSFHHQLEAIEEYIVANGLTLEEVYTLLSTNNQGYDERDAIAGATVMFDGKMQAIVAKAANIEIPERQAMVIGEVQDGTQTLITVKGYGLNEMLVQVRFDDAQSIVEVVILSHTETEGYGKEIIEGDYLAQFIDSDPSEIDGVAGATLTSEGIIEAVALAISALTD